MAQKGRARERRPVNVVVVSDVHLGTVGCHARELLNYLRSIRPEVLVLNGDVFDVVTVHSRWIARLGSAGYDMLILVNRLANFVSMKLGRGRISLSKRIKEGVKGALKFIGDFEKTAISIAIENGFGVVACGHIHQPAFKKIVTDKGQVTYLNSGDWVENLTALEYQGGEWSLFRYRDHENELEGEEHADKDLEEGTPSGPEGVPATVLNFTMSKRNSHGWRKIGNE